MPKVNGFFSLYPRECGELNSVLYGSTNAGFPRLADFLSVSQITAATNFLEWVPRDTFLPMVTAGQRPVYLDDTNAVLALLRPDFDGGQLVMLPPEAKPSVTVTNQSQVRVAFARFSTQSLQAEIEASAPSLVVCSQTFYHDWRAYVDGKPTRLLRANYAFQALEVPAGRHQVRLAYEDGAFRAGSLISCLSLAACLVAWLRILRRPETPATL